MRGLTLEQWSRIAEIVVALITLVGILASMWFSIRALREVQLDRKVRQKPFLAFERGGLELQVLFQARGRSIPGIDPEYVSSIFPNMPPDAESVRLKSELRSDGSSFTPHYGQLKNYGLGPALNARVTWRPQGIWIGAEHVSIDEKKLAEPLYGGELNCLPAIPSHVLPADESTLSRLPTFVVLDYEKRLTRIEGVLEIDYEDVFNQKHSTVQKFHLFTAYQDSDPNVHVTFSDIVKLP